MFITDVRQLWSKSAFVYEGEHHGLLLKRAGFVVRALLAYRSVKPLLHPPQNSVLANLLRDRPQTIGAVIWPYQCKSWKAATRLTRIAEHCAIAEALGAPVNLGVNDKLLLADLGSVRENLRVILDQPVWFMREGNLVLNLFVDQVRVFSLAFSLARGASGLTAVVGAIQGRDLDWALEEYRLMTKLAHGMRPRDLTIEIFRMFCSVAGVKEILAVSDECRHHRHKFFGNGRHKKFTTNYGAIWEDRGGVRVDQEFYSLELAGKRRGTEEVPPKKRNIYRRRYEMLDSIRQQIADAYTAASQGFPIRLASEQFES